MPPPARPVPALEPHRSYFTEVKAKRDKDLLVLPTDAVIFEDEGFK